MAGRSWLARRSRLSTILLVLLGLFLLGTVAVLSTAKAYFSIDKSAYILPEELGTWEEISWGSPSNSPLTWASKKYPWLQKLLHPNTSPSALAEAQAQAQAALANGQSASSEIGGPPMRDNSPRPPDPDSPPEKVPRIIHQTWKDDVLPPKWQAVRQECAEMHPDYEYMLWTDASSRAFIAEHYPWFLSAFDSYPYNIQRADAIRYFVLHHYGGVYMDLDIGCTRRLDPLLRFEIILPVTRPVGVSNDLMFAAKGHPFMDQLIHNLITFNHVYLSHYPTVMFSTGPMFVSASYGLYVDTHGPASPSTPSQPDSGFKGVRVLPKSLYGKNAKPAEVPDAFFKHFYGSSWHAGDADFLIFLRDHGRLLMFLGACVVIYGLCKTVLPKALFTLRKRSVSSSGGSSSRRRSQGRGGRGGDPQWVGLPFQTTTTTTRNISGDRSSKRRHGISRSFSQTPETRLDMEMSRMDASGDATKIHRASKSTASGSHKSTSSTTVASSGSSGSGSTLVPVAAPKPQRATLPFFELQEDEEDEDGNRPSSPSSHSSGDEPRGLLATWSASAAATVSGAAANATEGTSRPTSSAGSSHPSDYGSGSGSRWRQATNGVLLLPAYALSRIGSPGAFGFTGRRGDDADSDELSPSESLSSLNSEADGTTHARRNRRGSLRGANGVVGWAAQMLPAGWRGPVPSSTAAEERVRLQSDAGIYESAGEDEEARGSSFEGHGAPMSRAQSTTSSAWLDPDPETGRRSSLKPSPSSAGFLHPATAATGDTPYEQDVIDDAALRRGSIASTRTPPPPPPYAEKPL